ncbi:hypothetical protein INT46_009670 [Mucor plumbeus]|jgi:hypothetical protein|uniref:Uncharacterized protein n=1 Tax=Mucor plumbeus TaxID=97098 RepID=A0A8H7RNI9_9FUNG|nr:hypothetical protein INT46_009670 [Mucor plumbeus]
MSDINKNQQPKQQDIDCMTHPSVYRDTINERNGQKIDNGFKCSSTTTAQKEKEDWDLYPQMIRKVENEGTAKDVAHLHDMEHTLSK